MAIIVSSFGPDESFGSLSIGNIFVGTSITTGDVFGTLKLNQNIVAVSIASDENFTPTPLPLAIESSEVFGTILLGLEIEISSIASDEAFGPLSFGNIYIYSTIDTAEAFGYATVANISQIPLTSDIVSTQVPEFVREDHPKFLSFMQAYYEWLEFNNNTDYHIKKLLEYQDIDSTVDVFAQQLKKEFLANFPDTEADLPNVLKNIKQFYQSKGTEDSFKFFFRVLFNINTEFYYPRVDVFRASDATWILAKSIRVICRDNCNPFDLAGKRIVGVQSNANAFVNSVQKHYSHGNEYYELFLNNKTINGTFSATEIVTDENHTVEVEVRQSLTSVSVVSGGSGYQQGDVINISGNKDAIARVKSVTDTGAVKTIEILNNGYDFTEVPEITFQYYSRVTEEATATATIGTLIEYPGYFLNEGGTLSSTKYLHDGTYYQQFSYVLLVNESIDQYRDTLKKVLHPIGLALFGGFRSQELLDAKIEINSTGAGSNELSEIISLYCDATIEPHESDIAIIQTIENSNYALGPNMGSLEFDKLFFRANSFVNESLEMTGPNTDYWGNARETQTIVGDGVTSTFTLDYSIESANELNVFNHTNRTSEPFTLNSSTEIELDNIPGAGETVYIYYINKEIANAQIKDFDTLLDFNNNRSIFNVSQYEKINIMPEIIIRNVHDFGAISSSESMGTPTLTI